MTTTRSLSFSLGAVALVTFLSLIYTVDGQWRRSVAGEIVCDLQKLNRCVEMGERMLQDPRYVFPDTDSDVRDVCQEWENITMCMEEAMRTCVKFPDNEKQLFNNNVGKSIIYVSEICTKEQEKLEYLQHAPCLKEMTRNDFEYCGSYYGQLLSVTKDFKNGIERDEELCCGLSLYKECMLGKFNKCQRNMLRVFGDDPFRKGREYVSGLLDNALNAQTQHCSSLNYVMSSFNCPQMDKLMEETKRDNARLAIDSRDSSRNNADPASARSQPSDTWIDASRPNVNNNRANDRRGGRIDDPMANGGASNRDPAGSQQGSPSNGVTGDKTVLSGAAGSSRISGNNNEGIDSKPAVTDAPQRIDPPGRGPLRDRVNPAGTDGFRDNRERGGRRNDPPETNNGAPSGGYFGNNQPASNAQASTASQTDPKGSAPGTTSSNNRNNDGAYFGKTNYAGFGFDGRGKPNPRPPMADPWENPRTVSPINDINAQGFSGGTNGAEGHYAAALSSISTMMASLGLYLYGRWLSQ